MTTIQLEKDRLEKTKFKSVNELYTYLRDLIEPIEVFLVNDDQLPQGMSEKIEKAAQKTSDIVDFRG